MINSFSKKININGRCKFKDNKEYQSLLDNNSYHNHFFDFTLLTLFDFIFLFVVTFYNYGFIFICIASDRHF